MIKNKQFLVLLSLLVPLYCWAWGQEGHRIVGEIADANLTDSARAAVQRLLRDDRLANGELSQRQTLASVANWADEIKQTSVGKQQGPWHYRNNAVCKDALGTCKDGACIDVKIVEMTALLRDPGSSHAQQNTALKWLVHLVGDIHQPLHAGDNGDHGGNLVAVRLADPDGGLFDLHGVWDTQFVGLAVAGRPIVATLPDQYDARQPGDWLNESRMLAKDFGYRDLPQFACNAHRAQAVTLPVSYQHAATLLVRQQLEKAGLRLAHLMNQIFI
jgi:hypothetical protein